MGRPAEKLPLSQETLVYAPSLEAAALEGRSFFPSFEEEPEKNFYCRSRLFSRKLTTGLKRRHVDNALFLPERNGFKLDNLSLGN
jgi:hypothetical protein